MVLTHQPCKNLAWGRVGWGGQGAQCKERQSSAGGGVVLCVREGLEPNQIPKLAMSAPQI